MAPHIYHKASPVEQRMHQNRSIEHIMLNFIVFFDPIDWWSLKRRVREEVGDVETDTLRTALANLKELDLVAKPGMTHEYIHITEKGWAHVGGEMPRHENWPDVTESGCQYCRADEIVEAGW